MLAAHGGGGEPRLAALFRPWLLGEHRLRLVLEVWLFLGLGAVPLRTVVPAWQPGLVLDARYSLGTLMGDLAHGQQLLRLGAFAAGSGV